MLRGRRQKNGRPARRGPWFTLLLSLVVFALLGFVAIGLPREAFVFAGCLHSLTFVMVGLNLAATSGQLLFNPEEAEVLLHRPIDPRALLSAKLQTIALVSFALALAVNLCGLYVGVNGTPAGWLFLPAHLISLALEVLFATGFMVLAYNLCLRWFGRERLDNLMTAVQVTVAVGIMLGGQVLPRLLRDFDFSHLQMPVWLMVFPPIWFASLDLFLSGQALAKSQLVAAAFGVATTALVVWFGVVRLASTYEQGMETLNEAGPGATRVGGHGKWIARLRRWPLLRWWLRDPVEA